MKSNYLPDWVFKEYFCSPFTTWDSSLLSLLLGYDQRKVCIEFYETLFFSILLVFILSKLCLHCVDQVCCTYYLKAFKKPCKKDTFTMPLQYHQCLSANVDSSIFLLFSRHILAYSSLSLFLYLLINAIIPSSPKAYMEETMENLNT